MNLYRQIRPFEIEIDRLKKCISNRLAYKNPHKAIKEAEDKIKESEIQIDNIIKNFNLNKQSKINN